MISMLQLFFYHYPSHQLRISSEEEYKQIIDGQTIECLMYISNNLPKWDPKTPNFSISAIFVFQRRTDRNNVQGTAQLTWSYLTYFYQIKSYLNLANCKEF